MADAADTIAVRHFKKYPNRRLYDMGESRYVTLADVGALVHAGVPVRVTRALTLRDRAAQSLAPVDITTETLMEVLAAQERMAPRLTRHELRRMIMAGTPL